MVFSPQRREGAKVRKDFFSEKNIRAFVANFFTAKTRRRKGSQRFLFLNDAKALCLVFIMTFLKLKKMKKTYLTPEIESVKLDTEIMLVMTSESTPPDDEFTQAGSAPNPYKLPEA